MGQVINFPGTKIDYLDLSAAELEDAEKDNSKLDSEVDEEMLQFALELLDELDGMKHELQDMKTQAQELFQDDE